jgi:hypothetical protein
VQDLALFYKQGSSKSDERASSTIYGITSICAHGRFGVRIGRC